MINLPSKYDINSPENRGWLALYLAIVKKMSGEKAIKAMGMSVEIDKNKNKRKQGEVI